ncbi:DUF348 domain-containing protein [Mangrovibacillus cuniculi]|uniref:DUF348 domain-containing protein n=2 Tax=Mangrovibacillus cuniculi TaxID=2593652 RepID=A0A7S8HHA2_9BACI|nr:DUF348 domain-containing protein [Mangrovibacillus cuniculi]
MKNLFSKSLSKRIWAIVSFSVLLFVGVYGFFIFEGTKKTIAVELDGKTTEMQTRATTVEELLADLDIEVHSEDYVFPSLDKQLKNNDTVKWEPAKQVTVQNGSEKQTVWTTADNVQQLLKELEIQLGEHDQVQPSLDTAIAKNVEVKIDKAFALTLAVGGEKEEVWSTSTTVADFLKHQGVNLGELDRVEPSLTEVIEPKDVVNVVRVEKVTDVVEEPTDFAVVTKKDSNLTKGSEKVVQQGEKGLVKKEFEVIKENGKEVSRTLLSKESVKESKDKIVAVGTKTLTAQASRGTKSSQPASGSVKREFTVSSTAYTAHCNGCSGVTATGINLRNNPGMKVIAVDPNVIPLGTKVWVEGYGYAVAADTGSAIKGNKIDVFFAEKSQAYRWGRKSVTIRILD